MQMIFGLVRHSFLPHGCCLWERNECVMRPKNVCSRRLLLVTTWLLIIFMLLKTCKATFTLDSVPLKWKLTVLTRCSRELSIEYRVDRWDLILDTCQNHWTEAFMIIRSYEKTIYFSRHEQLQRPVAPQMQKLQRPVQRIRHRGINLSAKR